MAMILDKQVIDRALDVRLEPANRAARTSALAERATRTLRVKTTRFGEIDVDTDLILTFPEGMIGFEQHTRYIVISTEDNGAFRWLQSLDHPGIAFPILEPMTFRPDYAPSVSDTDARFLELSHDVPFLLFTIVTVPPHNPREMTANLLGPLVINGVTRRGKQVIVQDEGFTARHRVVDELLRASSNTAKTQAVAVAPQTGKAHAPRAA